MEVSPSAGSSPSLSLRWSVVLSTSLETPTHHPILSTTSQYVSRSVLVCCVCMCGWVGVNVLYQVHLLSPSLPLPLQVQLGNQQTIVGLITFQPAFNYLLFVVLPVLGGVLLCFILLLVVGCCVCQRRVRKKSRLLDELQGELHQIESSVVNTVKTG